MRISIHTPSKGQDDHCKGKPFKQQLCNPLTLVEPWINFTVALLESINSSSKSGSPNYFAMLLRWSLTITIGQPLLTIISNSCRPSVQRRNAGDALLKLMVAHRPLLLFGPIKVLNGSTASNLVFFFTKQVVDCVFLWQRCIFSIIWDATSWHFFAALQIYQNLFTLCCHLSY